MNQKLLANHIDRIKSDTIDKILTIVHLAMNNVNQADCLKYIKLISQHILDGENEINEIMNKMIEGEDIE